MPLDPEIERNNMLTKLDKPYKIRADQAVSLPSEVLAFLRWGVGDDLTMTVDVTKRTLTLEKANDKPSANT